MLQMPRQTQRQHGIFATDLHDLEFCEPNSLGEIEQGLAEMGAGDAAGGGRMFEGGAFVNL